jgi:exopolysaccharide production protein ExoQ
MGAFALALCMVGIVGLFYLDRDKSIRNSQALWLPVIWFWIVGSRPVSSWLGSGEPSGDPSLQLLDGSPTDRNVFLILLGAGIIVLLRRGSSAKAPLKANWPIVVFFTYALLSVLWSDFPDVTFKRWIKAIGDLVMVLIIATDANPIAALRRFFSRTGFILLPLSVLFIKYFDTGRAFDPDGYPMNTGVTTNKNVLGVVTLVISLGALWSVLRLLRSERQPNFSRHLLAHATLLAFGGVLLAMAHSATSVGCFFLGMTLMILTGLPGIRGSPVAVHVTVLILALTAGLTILVGGGGAITHAMGRQENFTGRTEIWASVFREVDNPLIGSGFESFWLGPRLQRVWSRLSDYMHVNEAHNGYLEMYLTLGWLGLILIALILITGYRRAVAAFRYDVSTAGLMLAYVASAAIYSVTEAGFRMLNPMWISLLLAAVGAVGIAARPDSQGAREVPRLPVQPAQPASWPGIHPLGAPAGQESEGSWGS